MGGCHWRKMLGIATFRCHELDSLSSEQTMLTAALMLPSSALAETAAARADAASGRLLGGASLSHKFSAEPAAP